MKVAFHTLGCKVNSYESQAMLNMFEEAGYEEVDFKEVADVYVVNTCTVTNTGDSKSRQMIRKAIRKNPQATVCVVGCYSQVAPQDIEAIEGVSIILGTQFRNEIVDLVEKYQQTHERIVKVSEVKQLRKFEDLNIDRFLHTRAYLKIQDGCNNFCTYCIIPYARGRVRSRKPESVIKQAKELVAKGYVEIVLTGIHTAGYGEDLENYSFYDLLVDLTKIEGLKRLRISSIETSQITDDIIDDTLHLLCIGNDDHVFIHIIEISQLNPPGFHIQPDFFRAVTKIAIYIDPGKGVRDLIGIDLGIKSQLIDQMIHLIGLIINGTHIPVHLLRRIRHTIHDPLHITLHRSDRRLQIMGNIADQLLILLIHQDLLFRGLLQTLTHLLKILAEHSDLIFIIHIERKVQISIPDLLGRLLQLVQRTQQRTVDPHDQQTAHKTDDQHAEKQHLSEQRLDLRHIIPDVRHDEHTAL